MGAQENTAIVQQMYAAFGRGDIPGVVKVLGDDIDWQAVVGVGPSVPTRGRRTGREQVTEFFGQVAASVDFERFEPQEFLAAGDKVAVLGVYEGRAKKTGRRFSSEWVMVFTLHGGKVVRFREYVDAEAINAAF